MPRAHSGLLKLLEGFAGVHGLMLANVPDQQDTVGPPKPCEEFVDLYGAGKARFVEDVQPAWFLLARSALDKELLEGTRGDACFLKAVSGSRSRREAPDAVTLILGGSANGAEGGCLSAPGDPLEASNLVSAF